MRDGGQTSDLPGILRGFGRVASKVRNVVVYETTSRCGRLIQAARFRLLRSALDRRRPVPASARGLSVRAVYDMAERDHRPTAAQDTRIRLFRATEGAGVDEPFSKLFADPDLGWLGLAGPDFRAVGVPGGHSSMLQEPHVAVLAACLQIELESLRTAGELDPP